MPRTMLDANEAADYLKISYYTILDKAKKGLIPCVRVGARVLFSQEGLDSWIEEQEQASISKHQGKEYGKLRAIRAE